MDIDEHLLWLLSALKLAQGSDEGNTSKLIQNVNNCFLRIKKEKKAANITAREAQEELQHFQAKATLLLLLCLPQIRELPCVEKCQDFQSVFSSLPKLSDSIFFTVVRSQKIYFLLSPLLSWLPSSVVQRLIKEYFHYTHDVTPVTVAISVELLKALLFSQQHGDSPQVDSSEANDSLELLVKFLSSKNVSGETPAVIKFSGYYFMYILKCLHLLLSAYVGCKIKEPITFPCIEPWTNLWRTNDTSTQDISLPYTKEALTSILTLCQNNSTKLTLDMWIEWSEHQLPHHITSPHHYGKGQAKSIQMATGNIAFHILALLQTHDAQIEESLAISQYHELLQCLKQTAVDPDYDPDQNLTLEQIVQEINGDDDRREKLLGVLVQREGVVACKDACACLKEHGGALDAQRKIELLQNCIKWLKADKPHIPECISVVVELAAELNPQQLKPVIEDSLSGGLDDTLKTPSFNTHLTSVFNQLADENTAEASGRHVWLCVQSGREVVEQAVRLAITMTGLVPVMVQTLADLSYVSQSKLQHSGHTVLASSLVEWQTSQLSDREEQQLIALVQHLLSVKGVLDAEEVLHLMVEPFLAMEGSQHLAKLILPLQLLKEVMSKDGDIVVRCGPEVVCLVVTLMQIMDATLCLEGHGASTCLSIRCLASTALSGISDIMASNRKKYEKEICLVQQVVSQHKLHAWSVMQVSQLLQAELHQDSGGGGGGGGGVDVLVQALMKTSLHVPQVVTLEPVTCASLHHAGFNKVSKEEWIITLLKVLPHCSEREWTSAFFITDYVLGSQNTVFAVVEVFKEALHLLCEAMASPAPKLSQQEPHTPMASPPTTLPQQEPHPPMAPVSLQHCFTFFTCASMMYLEERMEAQTPRERFLKLVDVWVWWCCCVPSFSCNPEVMALLLARLCGALEQIIVSGELKVLPDQHSKINSVCGVLSEHVSEREAELLSSDKINGEFSVGDKPERQHEEKYIDDQEKERSDVLGINVKQELEKIAFFMVEYIPFSNLLASIASKLKKMCEL